LLHNDDTPRILSLMRERMARRQRPLWPRRSAPGIVAELQGLKVVLFFTGHAHAGGEPGRGPGASGRELEPPCRCATLAANVNAEFTTVRV
jgi:hypothetical protein